MPHLFRINAAFLPQNAAKAPQTLYFASKTLHCTKMQGFSLSRTRRVSRGTYAPRVRRVSRGTPDQTPTRAFHVEQRRRRRGRAYVSRGTWRGRMAQRSARVILSEVEPRSGAERSAERKRRRDLAPSKTRLEIPTRQAASPYGFDSARVPRAPLRMTRSRMNVSRETRQGARMFHVKHSGRE